jgi:hypothetical protein
MAICNAIKTKTFFLIFTNVSFDHWKMVVTLSNVPNHIILVLKRYFVHLFRGVLYKLVSLLHKDMLGRYVRLCCMCVMKCVI